MKEYLCKQCNKKISHENKYCPYCGADLYETKNYCSNCKAMYSENTKYCPECANKCISIEQFNGTIIDDKENGSNIEMTDYDIASVVVNNDKIKTTFKVLGIINILLILLVSLALLFVPIFYLLNECYFGYNYIYDNFNGIAILIKRLCEAKKMNEVLKDNLSIMTGYNFFLLIFITVVSFLITQLFVSIKMIVGKYQDFFTRTVTRIIGSIWGKVIIIAVVYFFFELSLGKDAELVLTLGIKPLVSPYIIMLPLIISTIVIDMVSLLIRYILLKRIQPFKVVPKQLVAHRILHLLAAAGVLICFVELIWLYKAFDVNILKILVFKVYDSNTISVAVSKFINFLLIYAFVVFPRIEFAIGIIRISTATRQNELKNKLYENALIGNRFCFMCIIMNYASISYFSRFGTSLRTGTIVFLVYLKIFLTLLGLTIITNLLKRKAANAINNGECYES